MGAHLYRFTESEGWIKMVDLTTTGVQVGHDQRHTAIAAGNGTVFTGRLSEGAYGMVFVCLLPTETASSEKSLDSILPLTFLMVFFLGFLKF